MEDSADRRLLGLEFRRHHPLCGFTVDSYHLTLNLVLEIDGLVAPNGHSHHATSLISSVKPWGLAHRGRAARNRTGTRQFDEAPPLRPPQF